jgi:hypothetical protein
LRQPETTRMGISDIADMLTTHLRFSPMQHRQDASTRRLKRWTLEGLVKKCGARWPFAE